MQVSHAAFQFSIITTRRVEVFLGYRQLATERLAITRGTFAAGLGTARDQAQVVLRVDLGRCGVGTSATGRINLTRGRGQTATLAPGSILLRHLSDGLRLRERGDLLLIGKTQHLTGFQHIDVTADKRIRVQRLNGQHGLLNRPAIAHAGGDFPQRIAFAGGVSSRFGLRDRGRRGRLYRCRWRCGRRFRLDGRSGRKLRGRNSGCLRRGLRRIK